MIAPALCTKVHLLIFFPYCFLLAMLSSNPLLNADTLHSVLSYVGAGNWLPLATVSSSWKYACQKIASHRQAGFAAAGEAVSIVVLPRMTVSSAVFATASSLLLAHVNGFPLHSSREGLQFCAGKIADLATLKLAHKLGMVFTAEAALGAAASGSLAKVTWLHTEHKCSLLHNITAHAARSGSVELVRYLKQQGLMIDAEASLAAIAAGRLSVAQYLYSECYCPFATRACYAAAENADLEMLKWLQRTGNRWFGRRISYSAAQGGSVELMQWLQADSYVVLDADTMSTAARYGRRAMCEYLCSQQCPCDAAAFAAAAVGCHLSTLRLLHEHCRAKWDHRSVCIAAATGGSTAVLDYLQQQQQQQQGIRMDAPLLTHMLNAAGAHSHAAAVQWLRQRGAQWPAILKFDHVHPAVV
jgi:hypothetical protein